MFNHVHNGTVEEKLDAGRNWDFIALSLFIYSFIFYLFIYYIL